MTEPDSGYFRLEDQLAWYDQKSARAQKLYKTFRYLQFAMSILTPIFAVGDLKLLMTAAAGAVLALESVQQMNQWQGNWITYRATSEGLKHEKYSYLGGAGPYAGLTATKAKTLLVERVEALISREHTQWTSAQAAHREPRARQTEP